MLEVLEKVIQFEAFSIVLVFVPKQVNVPNSIKV